MNEIICPRCNLSLIAEEYREHECKKDFVGVKTIPVRSCYEPIMDGNGDQIQIADGEDGILYRLVHCTHNIPHILPMRRNLTERKDDKDLTKSCPEVLNTSTLKYGIDR